MKFRLSQILCAVSLLCCFDAKAVLLDNGTFTTDTESSLDWLDLSITSGISYNNSSILYSGWRYASNNEVEDLFQKAFDGFFSTISTPWSGLSRTEDGTYADQLEDVINFWSLFGLTFLDANLTQRFSYGLYLDENADLKFMGAVHDPTYAPFPGGRTVVYGPDYSGNEFPDLDEEYRFAGTYLVRASAVPDPVSTVPLLVAGLLVLLGFRYKAK